MGQNRLGGFFLREGTKTDEPDLAQDLIDKFITKETFFSL